MSKKKKLLNSLSDDCLNAFRNPNANDNSIRNDEIAEENGFDSAKDYIDFLNDNIFHIDEVNMELK